MTRFATSHCRQYEERRKCYYLDAHSRKEYASSLPQVRGCKLKSCIKLRREKNRLCLKSALPKILAHDKMSCDERTGTAYISVPECQKVTYVIPIERQRLTTKWIGIPFYKALFMGFQSTNVVDKLGMTRQGLSTL